VNADLLAFEVAYTHVWDLLDAMSLRAQPTDIDVEGWITSLDRLKEDLERSVRRDAG
jgi:hypothetical protein